MQVHRSTLFNKLKRTMLLWLKKKLSLSSLGLVICVSLLHFYSTRKILEFFYQQHYKPLVVSAKFHFSFCLTFHKIWCYCVIPATYHSFFRQDENTRLCNSSNVSLLLSYLIHQTQDATTRRYLIITHSLLDAIHLREFQELNCQTS